MPVALASATPDQFRHLLSFWSLATEVRSSTDDLDGLTILWEHDPDALVLATDDGTIVGTLVASWDGWRGGFFRLAIDPAKRNRGIARSLVAEGEARLQQRVSLYAVEAHAGAVAFWHPSGYTQDHRDIRFVPNLPPLDTT
jgi:ribosomal protein S18 acetylase RimI-like enzyme